MASMNDGSLEQGVDQEDDIQSKEARALALKDEGNAALASGHPSQAVALYTHALALHENAVLYGNRSMAYLKQESYGLAIEDADLALELDPSYLKALYRRASGNFALSKYKVALKDLKTVCKMCPKDKIARRKYKECDKAAKQAAFAAAIISDETAPFSLDPCAISVDSDYDGPRIDEDGTITIEFVRDMAERFRDQKMIHRKYVVMILNQISQILAALPNCMDLRVPTDDPSAVFTVCGDVHGQFYDLMNIFATNGEPSESRPYLFNGDFVDRGSFSVEVILTLFAYKIVYPLGLFMTRGNHESKSMNKIYGFEGEVKHKLDMDTARLFSVVFCHIPLCAVLEDKVFIVHGGLASTDDVTIADINRLDRCCEPPESGLMCDLLWSDPQALPGRSPSKRGVGLSFGPDVTSAFLARNGLSLIVRSHEMRDEGYELEHGGQLITVFSAPNYCDQMGNKGAFIHFSLDNDLKPRFTKFQAVPHPPVRPMQYANMMCQ
eukprot:CAMPEP_0185745854 /NCGR_PEP_ID=MMETSP1174-20130828/4235_1 /TAXON_ID=35687 /ORGANISM="Dictyocha speculum, Strain CCMP1381" /LENGTH=494 /DNA_ID=CAMNT_0028420103 /DNA_START=9 /DNA_END=1493 /DNA_ORIENTATION=+